MGDEDEECDPVASARTPSIGSLLRLAVCVVVATVMLVPYLWMLISSFKSTSDFNAHPFSFWPTAWTFATYVGAWVVGHVGVYTKNSFVYAISVTFFQLLLDSLAAYAFARKQFPGRDLLFYTLLATMMLPGMMTLIPNYVIIHHLHLLNSYWGEVLPSAAGAFGIFLLRQFFLNIPREMEEAAVIDGANDLQIFVRLMLPLAQPALIVLGIFVFMGEWNNFVWPLVVFSSYTKYPLTVGIALFDQMTVTFWSQIFAASVIGTLPLVALFFVAQRYVVGGLALSGVKS